MLGSWLTLNIAFLLLVSIVMDMDVAAYDIPCPYTLQASTNRHSFDIHLTLVYIRSLFQALLSTLQYIVVLIQL